MSLRALTIYPEWIYAILHLGKDVELRTWPAPKALIGQDLLLHAGAHIGGTGPKGECRARIRHFLERVRQVTGAPAPHGWHKVAEQLAGRPAALVRLGPPTLQHPSPWADPDGEVWAWPLGNLRPLTGPVIRGDQGLWTPPPDLLDHCLQQTPQAHITP